MVNSTDGEPVRPAAVPDVFWFRVATRAAATVPEAMLEPLIDVMLAPLPTNPPLAVTIPAAAILPLAYMVAAVPTLRPPVAVATPVILTLLKNVAGVPV